MFLHIVTYLIISGLNIFSTGKNKVLKEEKISVKEILGKIS